MKNWKRLVAMGAVVGLSINIANVSFGKQYAYTEPFDLPELTGDWRTDIIAVAESQLGYQEAEDGSTYFGAWIGEGEPTQAWCSEFVAWCAYAAKIPESVIPHKRSSNAYQKYFDQFDQFYFLEEGISPSVSGYGKSRAETISVEQLKPGDILLLETNDDYSDGADHTALFLDFSDGYILEISGNNGGAGVLKAFCLPERIHGVCKPAYDRDASPVATSSNGSHNGSGGTKGNGSSGGSGSSGSGAIKNKTNANTLVTTGNYVYEGTWVQSAGYWKLLKTDGTFAANQWAYIGGKWYIFDEIGQMITGWRNVNNYWYYMDGSGAMKTGWVFVDNKWYCLSDSGAMYASTTTPDGYLVDTSGAWIVSK